MIVFVAAMLPMVGHMKHPPGPETTILVSEVVQPLAAVTVTL